MACPISGNSGRSLHDRYRPAIRPKNLYGAIVVKAADAARSRRRRGRRPSAAGRLTGDPQCVTEGLSSRGGPGGGPHEIPRLSSDLRRPAWRAQPTALHASRLLVVRADDWQGVEEVAKGALKWLRGLSAVYDRRSDGAFSPSITATGLIEVGELSRLSSNGRLVRGPERCALLRPVGGRTFPGRATTGSVATGRSRVV